MSTEMRKTGVDVVGDMPWGTHFCLFYETKEDLLETLVSYCKAGLESQEFCLWVVADPVTEEDARRALKRAVPDCDRYLADQSIEIVTARDWYFRDGVFDLNKVINGWNEKLSRASAKGYAGVRVTGDTAWLEKKDWKDFCEYEEALNQAVANQRLAVLCTYRLGACGAAEILDVVRTHQFAVTKRRGEWNVIETAGHKQAKAEIKRLNEVLEQRVEERTSQLTSANRELTKEITQRQRAEEALLRSEAYLAEAQRVSQTGSFGWSVSTGHIVWSDETFRILGYAPDTKPTVEVIVRRTHPEDRAFVQEALDHVARDRVAFDFGHRLMMPDSSVKYVRVVGHPSTNEESGNFEFVGAVTDITESKRAEALREQESRILERIARDAPLEEILENLVRVLEDQFSGLLCSVLLLDEDGQHVRHGAAPSLPDAYTKALNGLCIGPKAGSCGTAMYRRQPVVVVDVLQDPLWEEYRDLAERYGLRACWSTPILTHSGKALGSFAMYYREPRTPGPSETRALEMATHLAGIAIERKLAGEERERLRQVQADLAHINRVTTMGELTASISHEIKQPMAAAVIDARTCSRWLGGDNPDIAEAREAASRIVENVMRASDIISSITSLFKKGTLQRQEVDLNDLISEMIVLLRSEAIRYSISIHSDLARDLPKVRADRLQLQQVMMNLMLNGIDAMKHAGTGGDLTIQSREDESGQLLISVGDTGVGLQPEQTEQIFNAFFTTKPQGTGMGLHISRSIIESHGGHLWAAAAHSGRGATFQFTLPREHAAYQAA
jgi:C4-dicarboxylate-specific signal transduction histidine kinase